MPNNLQFINCETRSFRRSRRQIFGATANYILDATRPFSKSTLREVGINPETAENYIKCFEIAQNTPRIIILRTGKRTSIDKESYPELTKQEKINYDTNRSMVEIFQEVSNYITNAPEPFHVSHLRDIGLDVKKAGIYIDCFGIAQNTPRIFVLRTGTSTVIGRSQSYVSSKN